MMQPDSEHLASIASTLAEGQFKVTIDETVPLAGTPAAIERNHAGRGPGKTIAASPSEQHRIGPGQTITVFRWADRLFRYSRRSLAESTAHRTGT